MNDFVNNIFFNNSPDASLIIREGLVCDINLAAERMFGGERNLLIGKPFKMLFSDFQADGRRSDHFIAEIVKNGSSGQAISFECLNRRFDGSDFHTEVSIAQVDLVGEIVLFVCLREYSASNRKATIYESDNVALALQESRERFREMADFLPQVIFEIDINGDFVFVNKQAFKIFGYPEDFEIIGLNSLDFHIPEERNIARENVRQLIEGVKIEGNEYKMVRRDGSTFPGLIYSNPIFHNNKPVGLRGIIVDISERKEVERKLFESENRYRLIIETANEGILVGQGTMLKFVNPRILELTGYTEKELLSRPFLEFVDPECRELLSRNQIKRIKGEAIDLKYHIKILRKDNSTRWVEMGGVKIEWDGQPATMNFVTDITKRKQVEEELKLQNARLHKINAEKDKFFSIIAHDIRSPFSGFLGLTQIMAEELPNLTMAEIQDIAVTMRNSATNLFRLLENLLQWSLIQQGQIPFNPHELALRQVVEESAAIVLEPARIKEIEIVNDISEELIGFADHHMLQTIFRNLISNAVKFTHRGGKINISARSIGENRIEFKVSDTGIGMSSTMINQLFMLDVQTGRSGTEGEVSTGIGLLLCKDFIEKLGGKLWIESSEEKGSTFYFTIPWKVTN